jgi:Family of unknown function (DUF6370)
MKKLIFAILLGVFSVAVNAQTTPQKPASAKVVTKQVVDIACGECQFKMKGKDCELAVKIDGKPYFVDGKGIDDFGDAHGEHGFCNAVSKAEVTGEIVNNRFKAKEIKLLPFKNSFTAKKRKAFRKDVLR